MSCIFPLSLSVSLTLCLSVSLSLCLSLSLSLCLFLCLCLSISNSLFLSLCLCLFLCLYLSVSFSLSLSLCLFLSVSLYRYQKNCLLSGHDHLLELRLLKNLLDTILLLLDTIRHQLIFGDELDSSSLTFRKKNSIARQSFARHFWQENINCSTQFIVKKIVYMYGS